MCYWRHIRKVKIKYDYRRIIGFYLVDRSLSTYTFVKKSMVVDIFSHTAKPF